MKSSLVLVIVILAFCFVSSSSAINTSPLIDSLRAVFSKRAVLGKEEPASSIVVACDNSASSLCSSFLKTNGTSCFASTRTNGSTAFCSLANGQPCSQNSEEVTLCERFTKDSQGVFCISNGGCGQKQQDE